jgi:SAM-dependent methyltransferase
VLEFGHGVGSTGILFARNGFDMTLYDISHNVSNFAKWRFGHRGLTADFLVGEDSLKRTGQYDVIVSMDVFEHLEDPLRSMRMLVDHLAPGGVLVLNIAFGLDPENPEHLLRGRLGFLDRLRGLGLQRATLGSPLVFYRSPAAGPPPWNRLVDATSAGWEDARHSRFRPLAAAVRRSRSFEAPPLMPGQSRAAAHLDEGHPTAGSAVEREGVRE